MKLLSMSGFIPEPICDTVRFTHYSGSRNISHYCGYASDFISQVMSDDSIDGAVFPHTCDSSRIMKSYMSDSGKFMYQMNVPIRGDDIAVRFFAESIKDYQRHVEEYYSVAISQDEIKERSELVNRRNAAVRELYNDLASVSYAQYLEQIHKALCLPLAEQTACISGVKKAGSRGTKRAFVVGSFLSDTDIAAKIEEYGFVVVGDDLPESGRLSSRPEVTPETDIYASIARSILHSRISPTQNDFSGLIRRDLDEMKQRDVQAVLFISQKYCEPYEYLYSVYKKAMNEAGIPILKLSFTNSEDSQKADLLLESFADTI